MSSSRLHRFGIATSGIYLVSGGPSPYWRRYGFRDRSERDGARQVAESMGLVTSHGSSLWEDGSLCYWLRVIDGSAR